MPKLHELKVGLEIPARTFEATEVSLFLYNAAIWNPHRIHYDEPYTTRVEKHPGVVIDGPLQGDWLTQAVVNWLSDDGTLIEFEYANRKASYLGEKLTTGGIVRDIEAEESIVALELWVKNEAGDITTPGSAKVLFDARAN
ncbi:MAG: hypothetical protein AAF384_18110 [Pseudomonadota bacterium]